ncbi:putative tricarboxylic transport membrane protein [Loktanella ponticola]|uniref:Putative tricarboxylic transport membrane protein n=1 Tax=Yoonia ponticola TaxID=1524255 RepID=A0A7W9BLI9_9RHOB|nr:tripartite tricarboxylate transporter TctB family protein [Yoonia ponticola]MBB5722748.1 putative tricarboxylic transport membrane protein [Yoonia ponticola]
MSHLSDRIFGLAVILVALVYIASAMQIQVSFLSDPVGSKAFPIGVASVAIICAVVMILRPDEEPEWPELWTVFSIIISIVLLIGYSYALKPLGFIIPTAIVASALSYQITPKPKFAVLSGLGLSLGLFVLFKFILDLGLIGFPKGWFV